MTHAISTKVQHELLSLSPLPTTILEIGTGEGTRLLTDSFDVISIEHDPQYHLGESQLIEVPLKRCRDMDLPDAFWKRFDEATEWYDPRILQQKLEGIQYDAILVDGPHGGARRAAMWWYYAKLFNTSVPVIIDDVHRRYDWAVAVKIAQIKRVQSLRVVVAYDKFDGENMFAVIQ